MLRASVPFTKRFALFKSSGGAEQRIEVLASGQQVVIHGVHPDTHKPYRWCGKKPWDVLAADLPYVDAAGADAFLHEAAQVLVREHDYVAVAAGAAGNGAGNEPGDFAVHADWLELFEKLHKQVDLHATLASLTMSMARAGMSALAITQTLCAAMYIAEGPRDTRYYDRYNDIPRMARSAVKKAGKQCAAERPEFVIGEGVVSEPWVWIGENRLAAGKLTLFAGDPGLGKSNLI
jgi:hypothetical protein